MKKYIIWAAQGAGLALSIIPAMLVFQGQISNDLNKQLMLVGLVLWFGATFLKQDPAKG